MGNLKDLLPGVRKRAWGGGEEGLAEVHPNPVTGASDQEKLPRLLSWSTGGPWMSMLVRGHQGQGTSQAFPGQRLFSEGRSRDLRAVNTQRARWFPAPTVSQGGCVLY